MTTTTPQVLRISSALRAAPESVWQHASSLQGINEELWPVHMSGPRETVLAPELVRSEPLFHSVVSLMRVFVLDLHEFKLVRVNAGKGFHEKSRSLLERRWEHIRTITPEPGGCVLSDELEFEPRLLPALMTMLVRRVFERRHAFLRRKFGELVVRG
jgi:hypothetical protein